MSFWKDLGDKWGDAYDRFYDTAFGEDNPTTYPMPDLFKLTPELAGEEKKWIDELYGQLGGVGNELMGRARSFGDSEAGEQALWDLESRRYLETVMPRMSARGLATSGQGITAEQSGLQDLATQFGARKFERNLQREQLFQQAAQGLAVLKSLPIQLRDQLLKTILYQEGEQDAPDTGWFGFNWNVGK